MGDASLRRGIERRLLATGLRVLDVDAFRVGPHTDVGAIAPLLAYARDLGASNVAFYVVSIG